MNVTNMPVKKISKHVTKDKYSNQTSSDSKKDLEEDKPSYIKVSRISNQWFKHGTVRHFLKNYKEVRKNNRKRIKEIRFVNSFDKCGTYVDYRNETE